MLYVQMKIQKFAKTKRMIQSLAVIVLAGLFVFSSAFSSLARADSISEQIDRLNRQNARNNDAVERLEDEAVSYRDAIDQLAGRIAQIEGKIAHNEEVITKLNKEIRAAEIELEKQRDLLGTNIRAMYLEGDISTLEMLASSNDLSDFLNKQQYRDAVQAKIKTTLDKITELKRQLKSQKQSIEKLLAEQKAQREQLAAAKAKQDQLLAYNEGQQSAYNANTLKNSARIAELIEQQRRANQSIGAGGYYFLRFPGNVQNHNVSVDDYPYRNARL